MGWKLHRLASFVNLSAAIVMATVFLESTLGAGLRSPAEREGSSSAEVGLASGVHDKGMSDRSDSIARENYLGWLNTVTNVQTAMESIVEARCVCLTRSLDLQSDSGGNDDRTFLLSRLSRDKLREEIGNLLYPGDGGSRENALRLAQDDLRNTREKAVFMMNVSGRTPRSYSDIVSTWMSDEQRGAFVLLRTHFTSVLLDELARMMEASINEDDSESLPATAERFINWTGTGASP